MPTEIPLQHDLFTGKLVDTRSATQKRQDRERSRLVQASLFSSRQQVELAAPARPWLNQFPPAPLALEIQDVRTDEEKERDWWREARKSIIPLFAETSTEQLTSELASSRTESQFPVLCINRDDLLKRRPDLAEQIRRLGDDELAFFAETVGKALEAVYGIMIHAVLAVYLEGKVQERLVVKDAIEQKSSTS